jgi:hypothetical protein
LAVFGDSDTQLTTILALVTLGATKNSIVSISNFCRAQGFNLNYLVLHALSQAISLCFYSQCKCCLSKRLVWYSNNWLSCSAVFVGKTIVNASLRQVGLHGIVVGVGEITGGLLFGIFGHFLTKKGGGSIKPLLPQPR